MKKARKWIFMGIVAVALLVFVLFRTVWAGEASIPISGTGTVLRGTLSSSVSASGTLVAQDVRDVYVETPVKVLEILADRDRPVRVGQPVLSVDLSDLESQLEQATLNLDSQKLTLQRVRDIDPSMSVASLQLAVKQAESMLASDREALARAQTDLETARPLYAAGALAETDFKRQERSVEDAGRRVSSSEISLSSAKANLASSQGTNRKTNEQRALDIATQENMLRLQELNVRTLTDRINRVKAALASPIDGVITVMNASVGSSLNVGLPAYQVSDMGALEVEAEVKEVESRRIRLGQRVMLTGDGIDESVEIEGKITRIASAATVVRTASGEETVLAITISVAQPPQALRPGLTVTANIITDTREDVPVIRYAMLSETPEGEPAVFLLREGRAVLVPIEMGISADLDIEVTTGLSGGETVILNPPQTLRDGMLVIVQQDGGGLFGGFRR